jgi:hypothetical protein
VRRLRTHQNSGLLFFARVRRTIFACLAICLVIFASSFAVQSSHLLKSCPLSILCLTRREKGQKERPLLPQKRCSQLGKPPCTCGKIACGLDHKQCKANRSPRVLPGGICRTTVCQRSYGFCAWAIASPQSASPRMLKRA